jgi:phosphohistidine phosphatase
MQLFIVRHGIASTSAGSDAERELSAEGRARLEAGVRGLARLGVRLERVLTSPLVRAVQTAEYLAPLLEGRSEVFEPLGHDPSTALLEGLRDEVPTALVGHEPWQSQLAGWLVIGEPRAAGFGLSPGGVIALEGRPTPGGMGLRGFWTPDDLIAVGGGA